MSDDSAPKTAPRPELTDDGEFLLKVRSGSSAPALASAISHGVYDSRKVILRAVGAGAVNQAVKALAIAQSYVGTRGLVLSFRPGFVTVKMPDREVSGIVFRVFVE
jgi:stage V sporulation protein S